MIINIMAYCCIGICLIILAVFVRTKPTEEESEQRELLERMLVPKKDKPVLMAGQTSTMIKLKGFSDDIKRKVVRVYVWIRDLELSRSRNDKEED